jgi:hypothetical protein
MRWRSVNHSPAADRAHGPARHAGVRAPRPHGAHRAAADPGALIATQAAAQLGESSGTCSFHLRQLAKYAVCEEAGGGRGREKPWRATATFTTWDMAAGDPERGDAEAHLNATVLQHYLGRISRWLADRQDDPREWQEAASYGDLTIALTAPELDALRDGIDALVRPYLGRMTGEEAPDGARRVALIGFAFPEPEAR